MIIIVIFESIPQLSVLIYEVFHWGLSVTFIQAFNPIFTIGMIYMNVGGWLGDKIFLAKRDPCCICMYIKILFQIFFPQLVISYFMNKNMISLDELPKKRKDALLEKGLYVRENPDVVFNLVK